jgi:hypothetical protein
MLLQEIHKMLSSSITELTHNILLIAAKVAIHLAQFTQICPWLHPKPILEILGGKLL